jgi:hypothetical protein
MIRVSRQRRIAAPPAAVFAALTEPDRLATLLPRVRRIELLEQRPNFARVATHMALGPFGTLRSEGEVRWQDGREVIFTTLRPVPVEAHWQLLAVDNATDLQATLTLDLAPLLGPLAAFVPTAEVERMVAADLEAALQAVAGAVRT